MILIARVQIKIFYEILALTTEHDTITMMHVKYVLIIGISDDGGCISLTTCMKNVSAIKIVISRLTFSPASGG